jgi:ribonuclease G
VLKWFRKKARSADEAPPEGGPAEQPAASDPSGGAEQDSDAAAKRRRRRGSRGGRGRKKTGPGAEATASAEAEPKPERKPREPRGGRGTRGGRDGKEGKDAKADAKPKRRRASTRRTSSGGSRAALAGVKKEIVVSVDVGETRVAIVEDGKASEVYLERPGHRSIAGNVYKGVVDNVLPGMEASFVEIGLPKNGFLYVDEIVVPELEGKRHGRRIQDLIQRGEEVLVQAVKDPMGTKGARLTTEISLPGRFLVYTPFGEGIGISRRLEDAERERLKKISKGLDLPEGGIIIRTAAEGASEEELQGDLALLQKLWGTIKARAERTKGPALIYQEAELPLRIVRDLFIRDFARVVVDHDRTYRRIVGYLKRTSQDLAQRVELYQGRERLMDVAGVDAAVRSTLDRRVNLPSGGYLIFDYAEAFTVIDVNTGRFVGARGKASGARLEDTITKNNLEAVEEVVRQLRLRDIGGIIVIDFIDMANPRNRAQVEDALRAELEKDRTKTYVVEISPLGLVEMTRQNVTDGPREILTVGCPTCAGDGIVVSVETHAVDAERELRRLVRTSRHQAFHIELAADVAPLLIGPGAERLAELERETGRRFFLETRDGVAGDHFVVLDRGPVSKLEPKLPVAAGDELDVKLVEPHPVLPGAAVGRLNGYTVAVADARSLLGKSTRVRIERATPGAAYAVVAGAAGSEAPVDAGEELEREDGSALPQRETPKPRSRGSRGGSRRKSASAKPAAEVEPAAEVAGEPEPADAVAETPVGTDTDTPGEETPKKKRTRRGSRGGRGRKKKTAATASQDGASPEVTAADGAAPADPTPEPAVEPEAAPEGASANGDGDGAAEQPKKKKTRRGSRGGRNRRKKPPAAPPGDTPEPVTAIAAEEEPRLD